jgi:protein tyrosine/serine phosphatase
VSLADRRPDWIALDGAVNARVVVPGVLLRADNLQSLSARDVRVLIDVEGVEVVIDLRTDVELALEGPGPMTREPTVRIEHRSLYPDSGENTDLELDAVRPWGQSDDEEFAQETRVVRAYLNYLRRRPDSVVGAIRTIAESQGATLVHCAAGKDRTGVVVALALDAIGFDRSAIVADYLASAGRIEQIVRRLLSSPTYKTELEGQSPRKLAPHPGTMERFFEIIDERFGGSVAWLSANGFEPSDLERLRNRLRSADAASAAG